MIGRGTDCACSGEELKGGRDDWWETAGAYPREDVTAANGARARENAHARMDMEIVCVEICNFVCAPTRDYQCSSHLDPDSAVFV